MKEYQENKKIITYNQQSEELTKIKQEYIWLYETNAQTLQYSLKCLDQAYQSFFNKRTKFPKFKSKKDKNTYTVPQGTKIKDNKIILYKFSEGIEMIMEREVFGKIKKATLSKTPTEKYFVSILTEQEYTPIKKTGREVGIDIGIKDFIVLSDGDKIKNKQFLKKYERKLKQNQQHLSRKTNGSKRYERQRLKVARIYEKITNSRMDLIHKTTSMLINKFDVIYLEDLNIKGMLKNHKLAKSISDVCWGKFIETLEYKSKWNNKNVIHVDRFFPSSKTCNICSHINNSLTLKDREWVCTECGTKHDRDRNAAINILKEGYRKNISVGTTDYGCGDQIRPVLSGTVYETSKDKKLNVSETER